MIVRPSRPSERSAIAALHLAAFGSEEAEVVSSLALALDALGGEVLSLLAVEVDTVLGHGVFSPAEVGALKGAILAPLAVAPNRQGQGIGGRLIAAGLSQLRDRGDQFVCVYGDPGYYMKHGFKADHAIEAPYDLQFPQGWQAQALGTTKLSEIQGTLQCVDPLMDPSMW